MSKVSERDQFLKSLGWNDFFQSEFELDGRCDLSQARIIGQGRGSYRIQAAPGLVLEATIHSKLHRLAESDKRIQFPAVGDWVLFSIEYGQPQANIHQVLKRQSVIQRQRSGAQHDIQVIAANVDFMFVVSSLNEDFDLIQLGRYLALGRDSGAMPVIILTKSDLCADPQDFVKQCQSEFEGIEIVLISNEEPQSLQLLQKYFALGKTTVLVGSSGVGKSTLTNFLVGIDSQKTQGLSAESRGRHTTTARNLLWASSGGLVIDTPGMQEITALDLSESEPQDFSDIEVSMLRCKFTNCRHGNEPGCAIATALKSGTLKPERWVDYLAATADTGRGKKKRT